MDKKKLFDKYLKLLKIKSSPPALEFLRKVVKSHLLRIPFENVSKLLYKKQGLNDIPDLSTYLDGIEKYNFGGTCYANNYYLNLLLNHLEFDAMLCGADMKNPDVHIVNIVTIDEDQYIVDAGYAAPFLEPMPRFYKTDYAIISGNEKFILKPQDDRGYTKIEHYYNDELKHWYITKPKARGIAEFRKVIKDSYSDDAMFMNIFRITRFTENSSIVLRNLQLTEITGSVYHTIELQKNELPHIVEEKFLIPANAAEEALATLGELQDTFG